MQRKIVLKHVLLIFVCVAIVGIVNDGPSVYAGNAPGITDSNIKLGMILDQTGPAANVTIPITRGIQSYLRHVNELGGGQWQESSITC